MGALRKVSILTIGSRGDIQPFIAIGVALEDAGIEVRIISNMNYASFVQNFNLQFAAFPKDVEKIVKEDPRLLQAMADGNIESYSKFMDEITEELCFDDCQMFLQEMRDNRPDLLIVSHWASYFCCFASRILEIPTISVKLQELSYDPKRAPWGLPTLRDGKHHEIVFDVLGTFYDRWRHNDKAMSQLHGTELMPAYSKDQFLRDWTEPPFPVIICQPAVFKSVLHPRSHVNVHFVGASVIEAVEQGRQEEHFGDSDTQMHIEDFISSDPEKKPVYLGWGSMISKSADYMVTFACRALQLSEQRGIVLGGWADLSMELLQKSTTDVNLIAFAEKNILFVNELSHEIVFPRVACTVHHGGAGTTNAALRSGVPTIVTPIFIDQFDHSHLVNELGVGFGFSSQLQKISVESLANAIKRVVSDKEISNRAQKLGDELREENGATNTVSKIKDFWEQYVEDGTYHATIQLGMKNVRDFDSDKEPSKSNV